MCRALWTLSGGKNKTPALCQSWALQMRTPLGGRGVKVHTLEERDENKRTLITKHSLIFLNSICVCEILCITKLALVHMLHRLGICELKFGNHGPGPLVCNCSSLKL